MVEEGQAGGAKAAPIFIIGSGRSGTSLLRRMMNRHSRIHICFESFHLQIASLLEGELENFLRIYASSPPARWMGFEGERTLLKARSLGESYRIVLVDGARRRGKVRWGDKTPMNAFNLNQVFESYPDARVVHIARDPLETLDSLERMPWAPDSRLLGALLLRKHFSLVRSWRNRVLEIRLEELLDQPEVVMRGVLEYVGESWESEVLEQSDADYADEPSFPWLRYTQRNQVFEGRRAYLVESFIRRALKSARRDFGYGSLPNRILWSGLRNELATLALECRASIRFGFRLWKAVRAVRKGRADALEKFHSLNPKAREYFYSEERELL